MSPRRASSPEPPDPPAVANRLHSAAIHLLRHVRRADPASGLSPARLSVLSALVFGDPRTVGALAEAEHVTAATMSRLVAALEAERLVTRRPAPDDRRAVLVTATPEGARLLLRARRDRMERLAARLQELDDGELAILERAAALLERVYRED